MCGLGAPARWRVSTSGRRGDKTASTLSRLELWPRRAHASGALRPGVLSRPALGANLAGAAHSGQLNRIKAGARRARIECRPAHQTGPLKSDLVHRAGRGNRFSYALVPAARGLANDLMIMPPGSWILAPGSWLLAPGAQPLLSAHFGLPSDSIHH